MTQHGGPHHCRGGNRESFYPPWTERIDLPFPLQYLLHGSMKVCRGMNSPMVCSRVFKGTLTKHPRYTMIFSRWIPFIVSKDKGPSLKYSFGFECSDFASCHWQGIVSHSGSWGLRILKLWATSIQGVSEEEFREIHKLGWEKMTLYYICSLLKYSIPLITNVGNKPQYYR